MATYDINGALLSSDSLMRFERGGIESNGALSNGTSASKKRSEMAFRCSGGSVNLSFETSGTISAAKAYFYSSAGAFLSSSDMTISGSSASASVPSGAAYYKVEVTMNGAADLIARCTGDVAYNPYIVNSSIGSSAAFIYRVARDAYTSGRLLLPPNYSMEGDPVPLIVFVHGSGGMTTWDAVIGVSATDDYRPYLTYLANEGFAVFDCFPWTDKESITTPVYSPYEVPSNIQSYLEGIRYVCSRFNVDGGMVNLLCKSQGGHFGHWACTQTMFPFKTVSLFAPSYGIGITTLMFNAALREAVTKYTDFDGTDSEISTFISDGKYSTAAVKSFCDKNKAQLVNLMPFAHGVVNSSLDELYALNFETLSAVPQWMLDEGLPTKPAGAITIGGMAAHNDYIKTSYYPVKFWGAFDDAATSMYNNYAICRWLQNGGSDAAFRTLPVGTGGHHAMDTDDNALKSSGTTALGIAYSNIPTAYVEVVEFIRMKCGD